MSVGRTAWGLAVALLAAACVPDDVYRDEPDDLFGEEADIAPRPEAVSFGELSVGDARQEPIYLDNFGLRDAWIDDLTIVGDPSLSLELPFALPVRVPSEGSITFDAWARATEPGLQTATVSAYVRDHDPPVVEVALDAFVRAPALVITPTPIDFGTRPLDCADARSVRLESVGNAPLTVDDLTLTEAGLGITLETPVPEGLVLEPGESWTTSLRYDRGRVGHTLVSLEATTNALQPKTRVTVRGETDWSQRQSDALIVDEVAPLRLVLSVDRSVSMRPLRDRVGGAVDVLIERLEALTHDWKLGVIVQEPGCFQRGVIDANVEDWQTVLREAIVSGAPLQTESQVGLLRDAMLETTQSGCNQGFMTPGADVRVVIFSDENDSTDENRSFYDETVYWLDYLEEIQVAVTHASELVVHGVLDTLESETCGLGSFTRGSRGYSDLVDATGGDTLNLCELDAPTDFPPLVDKLLDPGIAVPLSDPDLAPESLVVTVDGARWLDGWRYDPGPNAVRFLVAPPAGALVVVTYGRGGCEG